jgi:protein SCO1/2
MSRKLTWLILVVLLCAACGSSANTTATGPPPSKTRGFALKPAVAAPNFVLRDQNGKPTGPRQLRGHWFVVAFLYTHCPDVCPVIASNLGVALGQLPDLRVLAVSVDPKNDTPAAVKAFLRAHHLPARFKYVTGTHAQLAPVWARYHVAAIAGPKPIVSHTAFELLVDPHGHERVLYDAQVQARDVAADIKKLGA